MFSRGTSQLRRLRRTARGPQIPRWCGWVWVYNTAATIRHGAKTDTDAKVHGQALAQLDGPLQPLAVGPCP